MNDSVILNGRYRCVKKIGAGGMSSVFLCHDNHLDKLWAMKICDANNSRYGSGSLDEIKVLKSLQFNNFPTIVDAFFNNGKACIVTEYIEGENLKDIVKREGKIPYLLALDYFEVLIDALIYLHSQSPPILYLDMKPSNIMIRNDGTLFLIDFGIAGNIMCGFSGYGSIGYSPPEQYLKTTGCTDFRTDTFALGMTMYEILTGIPPDKDLDRMRQIISKDSHINKHIKQIILECTNKDITKRPDDSTLKRRLKSLKRKEKGVKTTLILIVLTLLISVAVVMIIGRKTYSYVNRSKSNTYTERMLEESLAYMDCGRHTKESLNVMASYVNGNFIDGDAAGEYTYEIAKAYFTDVRDYYQALRYFRKLFTKDESMNRFPDAVYYMELCEVMTDFSEDADRVLEVLNRFEEFNRHINDEYIKNENMKVIRLLRMEYMNEK